MGAANSKVDSDGSQVADSHKKIKEADRLVIDASSLACPTCFETYIKSPLVLQCGHSFCRNCISHFVRAPVGNDRHTKLECPLCLRRTSVIREGDPDQYAVTNFAVDNILDGLRTLASDDTCDMEEAVALIPTLRFENKRLKAELTEKERVVMELRQQIKTSETKFGVAKTAIDKRKNDTTNARKRRIARWIFDQIRSLVMVTGAGVLVALSYYLILYASDGIHTRTSLFIP